MKSFINIFLLLILPLVWNFAFIQWYLNTRDEVPLNEATIPESTLAFLDSLSNRLIGGGDDHLVFKVDTIGTDSWNNKHDFGRKDTNGFYVCDVDSLFVIYSDTKDPELVEKVHQFALSAIEPLKHMMGRYVYPSDVN